MKTVAKITYETLCVVCNVVKKLVWVRDQGNKEVYQCEDCGTEKSVTVR